MSRDYALYANGFGYGLFTKLPRTIIVRDFSPVSFKFKRGIQPPLAK